MFDGTSEAAPDARAVFLVNVAEGNEAGLGGEGETFVAGGHVQRVMQGQIKSKNCFALFEKKTLRISYFALDRRVQHRLRLSY